MSEEVLELAYRELIALAESLAGGNPVLLIDQLSLKEEIIMEEGISALEIVNFIEHIPDIPTRILEDVLQDIAYELKEREDHE